MATYQNKCKICIKRIMANDRLITCSVCHTPIHNKCLPTYSLEDITYASIDANQWTCMICLAELFPFNTIEDDTLYETIREPLNHNIDLEFLNNLIYDPFDSTVEDSGLHTFDNLDPDLNFLNSLGAAATLKCKYYYSNNLHDEIKPKMTDADISIFHLNIRSTPKNLEILLPTIHTAEIKFNIITLSETWLKPSNAECYGIPGYEHEYLTRGSKIGGGVSAYINDNWTYKVRHDLNINTDDIQILWVEINKENTKLQLISFWELSTADPGRTPTTSITSLTTKSLLSLQKKSNVYILVTIILTY
jgi:hypothetical protein